MAFGELPHHRPGLDLTGDDRAARGPIDRLTVAAIAIVAYAFANILHEGLGHGGTAYLYSVRYALVTTVPFIGGETPERYRRGLTLMLVPYVTGAALYLVAGAFNPAGFVMVAISAAPASLGGTSGLAWGPQYLRGNIIPQADESPTAIPRSTGWIAAAVGVGFVFVAILGPGITFGKS
jgi:hypothetical protein